MLIEIGHVEAIFRYPVKSMGGERLEVAKLGWHGLDGDRRLAFRWSRSTGIRTYHAVAVRALSRAGFAKGFALCSPLNRALGGRKTGEKL
jgi:uncharacterized protein YcbX